MPRSIKLSLVAFLLAFICEAIVEMALLRSSSPTWAAFLAICGSLIANPLAIAFAFKARRWAYELLKWIAAFSLAWTVIGGSYLYDVGLWAITLITLCVWLRLAAVLMFRRRAAKDWIEATKRVGFL